MFGTYELFRIRGLPIRMHGLTVVILILAFLNLKQRLPFGLALFYSVIWFVCILASIMVHEMGHILVGARYGIKTQDVILSPIGGVARMMGIPKNPHHEIRIALAGPLVSLCFAILGHGIAPIFLSLNLVTIGTVFAVIGWINLMLFAFNLLPSFPMDGGRVLRGILTQKQGILKATDLSAKIGRFMAIGFGVYGLATGQFMLAVLGTFIYFAAASEARMVRMQEAQRGLFDSGPSPVPEADFYVGPAPYSEKPNQRGGGAGFLNDVLGTAGDLFEETVRFFKT